MRSLPSRNQHSGLGTRGRCLGADPSRVHYGHLEVVEHRVRRILTARRTLSEVFHHEDPIVAALLTLTTLNEANPM